MTREDFECRYKSRILGILLMANRTPDSRGLGIHADRWISELENIIGDMWRAVEDAMPIKAEPPKQTTPAGTPPAGNQGRPGNQPARPTSTQGR